MAYWHDYNYIVVNGDEFPFIEKMYDPCDPGHTRGTPDYFMDQIEEAIINREGDFDSLYEQKMKLNDMIGNGIEFIVYGDDSEDEDN